jgi:hypothetical protein
MKPGDLVRLTDKYGFRWSEVGVIMREIPGWGQVKVVHWSQSGVVTHYAKDLEVINEAR